MNMIGLTPILFPKRLGHPILRNPHAFGVPSREAIVCRESITAPCGPEDERYNSGSLGYGGVAQLARVLDCRSTMAAWVRLVIENATAYDSRTYGRTGIDTREVSKYADLGCFGPRLVTK